MSWNCKTKRRFVSSWTAEDKRGQEVGDILPDNERGPILCAVIGFVCGPGNRIISQKQFVDSYLVKEK